MRFFITFVLVIAAFLAGFFLKESLVASFHKTPFSEGREKGSFGEQRSVARQVNFGLDADVRVQRNNALVQAISKASASVVFIGVTQIKVVDNPMFDDPFFRQFFPPTVNEYRSMGSGVILTEKGHIITNYHVIENATSIEVHLSDGRKMKGQLVGADPYTDMAIIKIPGSGFPAVKVAEDDALYIGEWAIAIGNPFGALIRDNRPTVTMGVISAYGREFTRESGIKYTNMIQTDAAINPGNSGGALVNCFGELIGINTFIISPSGQGNIGLGFAIPASRVMKTLKEILQYGKIRPFYTGIAIQNLTPYIAGSLGLKNVKGVIVNGVERKSPGEKCGVKVGDVLLQANKKEIIDQQSISDIFNQFLPGDEVILLLIRDGKEKELVLTLEAKE